MRRIIAGFATLGLFIIFSASCYFSAPIDPKLVPTSKTDIVKIEKNSGEIIEFKNENPALYTGIAVKGYEKSYFSDAYTRLEISISDVKQAWERKIDLIKSIIAIGVPAYLLYAMLKAASALHGIGNFNLGFPAKTIR